MHAPRLRPFIPAAALLSAVWLGGCTIQVAGPGDGGSATAPPSAITVKIVNATDKALDPQIYVGPSAAGVPALFTDANKKRDFGFGGLGYVEPSSEASFSIPCGQQVLIGTQGGAYGDNLNTPLGRGQQLVLEEDVSVRCTYVLTFTFSASGNQLVNEYSVRPWEP
jgi:hypothetical protein